MSEIKKLEGKSYCDDRGFVRSVNDLEIFKFKRFYTIENHRQVFVRAWHGHKKGTTAVVCLRGAAIVGVVNMNTPPVLNKESTEVAITRFILCADNPQAIVVPPGFANGAKTLTNDCILLYFSDTSIEETKDDDFRFAWDTWGYKVWQEEYR